jgi:hypothetical protein
VQYSTLDAVNDGVYSKLSKNNATGMSWSTWAGNTADPAQGCGEQWVEY